MTGNTGGHMPWQAVTGFGGHIRATSSTLSIQKKNQLREYPINTVQHLLVCGEHNINTSVFSNILKKKGCISFFDADGTPLSHLRPYGFRQDEEMRALQKKAPGHARSLEIVRASIKSRMVLIEDTASETSKDLFYEGEREFLYNLLDDAEYLIKMDELRRIQKLGDDMYYEIMSRSIQPEHGFRRRSEKPHKDPVNAMLSIAHAMLFGNCCLPLTGANLDCDIGVFGNGAGALVEDLIDPLKPRMTDAAVFRIARSFMTPEMYKVTSRRCSLSEELMDELMHELHRSVVQTDIEKYVLAYRDSIADMQQFKIIY